MSEYFIFCVGGMKQRLPFCALATKCLSAFLFHSNLQSIINQLSVYYVYSIPIQIYLSSQPSYQAIRLLDYYTQYSLRFVLYLSFSWLSIAFSD